MRRGVRSSLARHQPVEPLDAHELEAMARAAWLKRGVVMVRPAEITCQWLKAAIEQWATERYGKRRE